MTHDPKVAAFAHRTIRIADGQIHGDNTATPANDGDGNGRGNLDGFPVDLRGTATGRV